MFIYKKPNRQTMYLAMYPPIYFEKHAEQDGFFRSLQSQSGPQVHTLQPQQVVGDVEGVSIPSIESKKSM
jgi:hypothetical protein